MKRQRAVRVSVLVALFLVFIAGMAYVVPALGLATTDISTGGDTNIPPRVYDVSPEMATTFTTAAIGRLPGWRIVPLKRKSNRVQVEIARPLGLASDQLTVFISPSGQGTLVRVRSRSRFGASESVRHIRTLQTEMDARLPAL